VAGRSRRVLDQLVARGAEAAVRIDRPAGELAAAIAAGPYDLIVDYLWGEPAEAVFAALMRPARTPDLIRYILVGMAAGEVAGAAFLRRSQSSMREPMMTVRSRGRRKYSAASAVIREVAMNRRLRQRLMPGVMPRRSSMVDRK
jgi:hypothetical protein